MEKHLVKVKIFLFLFLVVIVVYYKYLKLVKHDFKNMELQIGDKVPKFKGYDCKGNLLTSSILMNKKYILYFYPKNFTPGCTRQACSLRNDNDEIKNLGFTVFGVSNNSVASNIEFKKEKKLPFDLISDKDNSIAKSFGVWRKFFFNKRRTFIINKKGIILYVIKSIDTKNHGQQIIKILKKIQQSII